jgi:hypothetical protein
MNHSFRVNPLVEGFVIEKVVVVGSVHRDMSALAISDASIAISTLGDFFMSLPDDLVAVAIV